MAHDPQSRAVLARIRRDPNEARTRPRLTSLPGLTTSTLPSFIPLSIPLLLSPSLIMTWQLATRGTVLRRVRVGALPRAARVVGLQHQLQRLSLAATPRPARPLTGYLASPKLQAPLRLFATSVDSSEPKAKKKKTTTAKGQSKKSKKPKKSTKPKKRELTEEQKAAKAERKKVVQRRALVQQLKQTALTPPKRLPDQYFSLVVQAKYADVKTPSITQSEAFQAVSQIASSLSAEEKEVHTYPCVDHGTMLTSNLAL